MCMRSILRNWRTVFQRDTAREIFKVVADEILEIITKGIDGGIFKQTPKKCSKEFWKKNAEFPVEIYWWIFPRNYRWSSQSNNWRGIQKIFQMSRRVGDEIPKDIRSKFYRRCRRYSGKICCRISLNYWRNLKEVILRILIRIIKGVYRIVEGVFEGIIEGIAIA